MNYICNADDRQNSYSIDSKIPFMLKYTIMYVALIQKNPAIKLMHNAFFSLEFYVTLNERAL